MRTRPIPSGSPQREQPRPHSAPIESDDTERMHPDEAGSAPPDAERRDFLARVSSLAMTGGLVAGYGTLGAIATRYLFPAHPRPLAWMFVARVSDLVASGSLSYRAPSGEKITIARQGSGVAAEDFVALSSTCPHLGCQVHWEGHNSRFLCPCHNGTFDVAGRSTSGPPFEAGQSLPRYSLKVEDGLVYIEVPTEKLASGDSPTVGRVERRESPRGPGHDPCLFPDPPSPRA